MAESFFYCDPEGDGRGIRFDADAAAAEVTRLALAELRAAIGTPFVRRAVQDFITESPGNPANWTKALTEGVFRLRLAAAFLPPGLGELAARGLDWLDVRAQSPAVAGFMAEAARAVLLPLTEQMTNDLP